MTEGEEARLLAIMNAMFEGQKRTLGMVEAAIEKFDSVGTEITKLNRRMNALQELAVRNHAETSGRLDAISFRLEETERVLDEHGRVIKKMQIEVVSQYNEVLTALRDASYASRIADGMDARLAEVERRIAHL
ncbi:hypothetical protein [Rhizobium sp. C1]|uniref:hypothetical protein n=1 Tax=Rhizobium sp. C1 TaxID=1349799 RepID=UPI001E515DCA|nr:hypothetical protein [Rhizobium sp. C1]MCD2180127.1 hypothetical protein [Rhizobium sp. C1]